MANGQVFLTQTSVSSPEWEKSPKYEPVLTSLKSLSGYSQIEENTDFKIIPFKCQDIKSSRFSFGLDEKLHLLGSQNFFPSPSPRICPCLQALAWNLLLQWVVLVCPLLHGDSVSPGEPTHLEYPSAIADTQQCLSYYRKYSIWSLGTMNLPKISTYEFSDLLFPIKANSIHFNNIHAIFLLSHLKPSTLCTSHQIIR